MGVRAVREGILKELTYSGGLPTELCAHTVATCWAAAIVPEGLCPGASSDSMLGLPRASLQTRSTAGLHVTDVKYTQRLVMMRDHQRLQQGH